jgi:hypothetical protein|tara:strand:+ start:2111 stop:2284 length:174 start_codon:yes stop_codon:yes gene_type:complete
LLLEQVRPAALAVQNQNAPAAHLLLQGGATIPTEEWAAGVGCAEVYAELKSLLAGEE